MIINKKKKKKKKKKNRERKEKRERNELWNTKVMLIPIVIGVFGTTPRGFLKGTGRDGNQRTSRYHPNYSIVEITQNTEKSPGNLRRFCVTQTPVV